MHYCAIMESIGTQRLPLKQSCGQNGHGIIMVIILRVLVAGLVVHIHYMLGLNNGNKLQSIKPWHETQKGTDVI